MTDIVKIKLDKKNARFIDQDNENLDRKQFIREYTKNGMQADERYRKENPNYEEKGIVEWNERTDMCCPVTHKDTNVPKLCITDNGIGMSKQELLENTTGLGTSSNIEAKDRNFGIGAKMSALAQNRAGVMFHTFQNGRGLVALMHYNKEFDSYGLMELDPNGGEYKFITPLDEVPSIAKEIITEGHGTVVTFLGNDVFKDDTTSQYHWDIPMPQTFNKKAWVRHILNRKICELPEHLEIRALGYPDKNGKCRAQKITPLNISVMKDTGNIESHGRVELSNGNSIEWAVLPTSTDSKGKKLRNTGSKQNEYSAHYCCVMEGESYEFRHTKKSPGVLNQCGIYHQERILLHFHLEEDFEPNKYRTQIRSTKHDTPNFFGSTICAEICKEFQSKLPPEIQKIQEEEENKIIKENNNNDYIKQYPRLHTVPETSVSTNDEGEDGEGQTKNFLFRPSLNEPEIIPTPGPDPKPRVNEHERVIPNPNKRGKRKSSAAPSYPDITWSEPTMPHITRQFGKDMGACLHKETNVIYVNKNFSKWDTWIAEITKQPWFTKSKKGFKKGDIKKHIKTEVENTLKDAILTVPTLEAGRWGPEDVEEGLKPISLTVAIAGAQIKIIEGFKHYMKENKPRFSDAASPEALNGTTSRVTDYYNNQVVG